MNDLPVNISTTEEALPFRWRLTAHADRRLEVEAGDDLVINPAYGGTDSGVVRQIGVSSLASACQLLGLTKDEWTLIIQLALGIGAGTEIDFEDDVDG